MIHVMEDEGGWHAQLPRLGTMLQLVAVSVEGDGTRFMLYEPFRGIVWTVVILFSRRTEPGVRFVFPASPSPS